MVDNSAAAFPYHLENGLVIRSWYDDRSDRELPRCLAALAALAPLADVRDAIVWQRGLWAGDDRSRGGAWGGGSGDGGWGGSTAGDYRYGSEGGASGCSNCNDRGGGGAGVGADVSGGGSSSDGSERERSSTDEDGAFCSECGGDDGSAGSSTLLSAAKSLLAAPPLCSAPPLAFAWQAGGVRQEIRPMMLPEPAR
ncbi:unnamed protein product [Phaeothamnion confervicola]